MTTELWCLVGLTLWTLPLLYVGPVGTMKLHGVGWGVGNRADQVETPAWVKRAERAANNHKENLPLFAIIVLVLHVTQKHDEVTVGASVVYVAARIAHSVLYWVGVEKLALRTVFYYVAIGALLLLVTRLA